MVKVNIMFITRNSTGKTKYIEFVFGEKEHRSNRE